MTGNDARPAGEAETGRVEDVPKTCLDERHRERQPHEPKLGWDVILFAGGIKQDPSSVSLADFKARLVENERKILEKNPGKQVEFEILVQNNQITFKPIVK